MLTFLKVFASLLQIGIAVQGHDSKEFNFNFQPNNYKVKFEHIDVVGYNKEYVEQFTLFTFKFNRTCTAVNATALFKKNLERNLELVLQAYKFASNEYRLFPLRFQFNFCHVLSTTTFGINAMGKCGNLSKCPLKKGINYHACNFAPNQFEFPSFIPTGRYKTVLEGLKYLVSVNIGPWFQRICRDLSSVCSKIILVFN